MSDPSIDPPRPALSPRLDVSLWPRALWQQPLLALLLFVLGGGASFIYSYAPLHRAQEWRISYLEERLTVRNDQVHELEEQLRESQAVLQTLPTPEGIAALEAELGETSALLASRDQEVASLERRLEKSKRATRVHAQPKTVKPPVKKPAPPPVPDEIANTAPAPEPIVLPAPEPASAQPSLPGEEAESFPASPAGDASPDPAPTLEGKDDSGATAAPATDPALPSQPDA